MFNQGSFVERAARGEIQEIIVHSGIPSPEVGLPLGSQSQMILYVDENGLELLERIATCFPMVALAQVENQIPSGSLRTARFTGFKKRSARGEPGRRASLSGALPTSSGVAQGLVIQPLAPPGWCGYFDTPLF